ncbi:DUF445 domain-containing protein [Neobacillus pocheonensis]|uniref:DUF445 domain-containing protein n=1 Tax=Neobacillus pocheonensis TaxID=363869 RepID=UPI003D2C8540
MLKQKNKSRHLATISLAVMAIGFLATMPLQNSLWGAILQGGFEAGLVGGLADWFAVTALFRHPLGIPIPHTALLPKNRKRIIAGIISMLENDWLTKESIREKIGTFNFSEKVLMIIEKELHSPGIQTNFKALIQYLLSKVEINKIAPVIEKEIKAYLNEFNIRHYLSLLIDQVSIRKYDEKALDLILKEIDEWASRETTKYKLGGMAVEAIENIKADGIMQFALRSFSNLINEEKLGGILQNLILKGVDSFRDPYNQNRQTLLIHIHNKLQNIKTDEKINDELEHLKTQMIAKWEPEDKIIGFLTKLQQKAIDIVEDPVFYHDYILPLIEKGLMEFKENPEKVNNLEAWIKKQISTFVDNNHSKIGKLVEENLERLDNETLIDMIENNVGRDLQWIRVNGAVCGFLIGLVLIGIKTIF